MPVKTIYLLLGPKGSGKSFIGKILEDHFGIPFLYVEDWVKSIRQDRDVTDPGYVRDAFMTIEAGVRAALQSQEKVAFESTGLSDAFDAMLARLKEDYHVILIRVNAGLDLCFERIKARNASLHIPISEEQLREINARVMQKVIPCDYTLDNQDTPLPVLIEQLEQILQISENRIIPVTCAIILHDGKVLVTQRSARMKMPLKWEFPGGKLEPGESPEECLLREIREELGIHIRLIRPLSPSEYVYDQVTIRLLPFVAEYIGGEIVLAEHADYRWLERLHLRDIDWAEADVAVLEEFLR